MTLFDRYHRFLLYFVKWWCVAFVAVSTIVIVCVLADWIGRIGWGYPWWSLPVLIAALVGAMVLHRIAAAALR
jgi:hypothetical protein